MADSREPALDPYLVRAERGKLLGSDRKALWPGQPERVTLHHGSSHLMALTRTAFTPFPSPNPGRGSVREPTRTLYSPPLELGEGRGVGASVNLTPAHQRLHVAAWDTIYQTGPGSCGATW
ncbi:hypothetical protein NITHO_6060002 [Nitrolancea hollandica Lb]|uniref:Uncharacterized protein n=1 Tax=Nitrolancea hollandica Lb TaxID=1129897 RepID=I4EMH7_9BACT|nr:hypothetical protein NITHO_6060002 [Nitrolancea hollandica Lb]